jgi:hypothetical protein
MSKKAKKGEKSRFLTILRNLDVPLTMSTPLGDLIAALHAV